MRWTGGAKDEWRQLRTAKSFGPDTSMVGVQVGERNFAGDVTTKPDHRLFDSHIAKTDFFNGYRYALWAIRYCANRSK